jgi:hypothetical protein
MTDDRAEIIELVNAIFDAVDEKDWGTAQELFDGKVTVDFTSLDGGDIATISGAELVDGWRRGLHLGKKSFHMVGHHRVAVYGEHAAAAVKGYAYNVLDDEFGGGMWEVWGAYEIQFRRDGGGWKATGFAFFAWHTRGDDAVRTHVLPS